MANEASSNGEASNGKGKQHIGNAPKFSQQRRSAAPRRRTDFSPLLQPSSSCSSSPSDAVVRQGQSMKPVTDADSPSNGIIATFDGTKSQKQSPGKRDSPDSIKTHSESPMRRSARARKTSVRFDKEIIPSKPTKQARRIKILRYLGLAPPAGSPYARPTIIFD